MAKKKDRLSDSSASPEVIMQRGVHSIDREALSAEEREAIRQSAKERTTEPEDGVGFGVDD